VNKAGHRLNRIRLRALSAVPPKAGAPVFRARLSPGERLVALSFDDGPSDELTPSLLDLLRRHGVRATFFVVGRELDGREKIIRRATADGHELANHTHTHRHPFELSDAELAEELELANAAISAAASVRPRLARPPFGKARQRFAETAARLWLSTVLWSVDSGDSLAYSGSQIARFVCAARSGDIILLHDGGKRRPNTLEATERALIALRRKGFGFVTVSELLATGRKTAADPAADSGEN
jgi:peptidoglycan/xylan/chitin deacetylase (PgdA/CDA1 family)